MCSITIGIIFQTGVLPAQEFLIINNNRELFRVNIELCSIQYVSSVQIDGGGSISDITYTDDGRLWGITTDGRLYVITEASGEAVLAHTLPNNDMPFFTSLVADGEGGIYAAGANGALYVFDTNTLADTFLGNIGYGSAGDLTFYQGQLIMASTTNQMITVDLDNPANSSVRLNFNAGGQIFGIVTFVEDCDNTATYATNDSQNGVAFQIDFESGQLSQVCSLGTQIFGAASLLEFLAANPIVVETVNTAPTSCTNPQGMIEVLAGGGNGPLAYSLDSLNFQSNGTFTGLFPGDYTVYIQDGQGCSASRIITVEVIGEAPAITNISVRPDSCGLGIGGIEVEAVGGLLPYQYALNGRPPVSNSGFDGLFGGVYEISVIDGRGCMDSQTIPLPGGPGPQIERIGVKPCGPGQNSLFIEASGGDGALAYSLDGGPGQPAPEFTGLDAGTYLISAIDEAGCTDSRPVDIPLVDPLEFTDIGIDACGQSNSYLQVTATGGSGPLAYSLDGDSLQNSGFFEGLSAGLYTLLVIDKNACTVISTISIPEYAPPRLLSVDVAPSRCGAANGVLRLETDGGTAPFLYTLDGREQADPTFTGLAPGRFLLSILDAEGCSTTDTVMVGQRCPIFIPNVFSPNEDGRNDRFGLYSGEEVQVLAFRIFNRWGGMVYEQLAFSSLEKNRFWDGRFRGEPAPAGIYGFYVEVVNAAGEETFFEGGVLLVR
ncbi:MAG: gliding motility-associated C-terminal domain-containing protein [Phaeodactylibacter sp.]|nr:gliding motility-associated C-terminal domain-containing protein [Phaeodactylibacter sp.]